LISIVIGLVGRENFENEIFSCLGWGKCHLVKCLSIDYIHAHMDDIT